MAIAIKCIALYKFFEEVIIMRSELQEYQEVEEAAMKFVFTHSVLVCFLIS